MALAARSHPPVDLLSSNTLIVCNNLAVALLDQGRPHEAEPWFDRALSGKKESLGLWHASTVVTAENLAFCLKDQGKME